MRLVAVFLGLLVIAGCGSSARMPSQHYQSPTSEPRPALAKVVSLPADAAAAQALAGIKGSTLTPAYVDLASGVVVATYSGDPEGLVDCGSVRFGRGGRLVPASSDFFIVNNLTEREMYGSTVGRGLQLDSRLVIAALPYGTSTSVIVDATHVLTKTIGLDDETVRSEVIAFDGQGSGSFQKGTDCHSTGQLEELALAGVPGPLVRLSVPQTQQFAAAQPMAPSGQQVAVTPLAPPAQLAVPPPPGSAAPPQVSPAAAAPTFVAPSVTREASLDCGQPVGGPVGEMCELTTLLAPYRTGGLDARPLQGDRPLREGENLVLELALPGGPGDLQLSYVDSAGVVTHLPILPIRSDIRHSIYATGLPVTAPFGQVVLVMASNDQRIAGTRPPREPVASYVDALRQGLSRQSAPITADTLVVTPVAR